jgi:hypothetical protein
VRYILSFEGTPFNHPSLFSVPKIFTINLAHSLKTLMKGKGKLEFDDDFLANGWHIDEHQSMLKVHALVLPLSPNV